MDDVGGPSLAQRLSPRVDDRRLGFQPPARRRMDFGAGETVTLDDILAAVWNELGQRVPALDAASWAEPPFWAKPLTLSRIRLISAGAPWGTFLRVVLDPGHVTVVRQFVATCEGSMATNGLQYRLRFGRGLLTDVQLDQGSDLCRDAAVGAGAWPANRRSLLLICSQNRHNGSGVELQVRNTGLADVRACAALLGWTYRDRTSLPGAAAAGVDPQ